MSVDPELIAGCKNGSCPKIFYSDARAAVQGAIETSSTRQIVAVGREAVVEIPIAVLTEALDELKRRHGTAAQRSATGSQAGPLVRRIGDVVIVRGDTGTDLTEQIEPGAGELVVEVPLGVLLSHSDMAVV